MGDQCYKKMKTTVSGEVSFENKTFWRQHTETLIKQGNFLCLAMLEKSDMIWKSCMVNLNKGTVNLVRNSRIKNSIKEKLQRETQYNKPGWID